jgi:hypothetical protein
METFPMRFDNITFGFRGDMKKKMPKTRCNNHPDWRGMQNTDGSANQNSRDIFYSKLPKLDVTIIMIG